MRQMYLDPLTHDLAIGKDYNLRITTGTGEELVQKIKSSLLWFKGEWFLDREGGVPYFQRILKKQVDINDVRALLVAKVSGIEGVKEIISFETSYDAAARELAISFEVMAESGETAAGEVTI